jgi:aryl-alcohol dehydrogenase-like predicted oxidoreductase
LYSAPDFCVATVRKSLESSLRALRTDYVDFFLAHQASPAALPTEETVEMLEELQRSGKIVEFGVATDFDWLLPVVRLRPSLARVLQFDSELTTGHAVRLSGVSRRLVITYGFIGRTVAICRDRLQRAPDSLADLASADDTTLGGLLLRAAVLANPDGITLMQSRSPTRIERNVRAAGSAAADEQVNRLRALLEPQR